MKTETINIKPKITKLSEGWSVETRTDMDCLHMRNIDKKYFEDKIKIEEKALTLDVDDIVLEQLKEIQQKNTSNLIIDIANKIAASTKTSGNYIISNNL